MLINDTALSIETKIYWLIDTKDHERTHTLVHGYMWSLIKEQKSCRDVGENKPIDVVT